MELVLLGLVVVGVFAYFFYKSRPETKALVQKLEDVIKKDVVTKVEEITKEVKDEAKSKPKKAKQAKPKVEPLVAEEPKKPATKRKAKTVPVATEEPKKPATKKKPKIELSK